MTSERQNRLLRVLSCTLLFLGLRLHGWGFWSTAASATGLLLVFNLILVLWSGIREGAE
jgi:hypothetical protein